MTASLPWPSWNAPWRAGKPYDLAFMDQMMPGMAGGELAQRIRANQDLSGIRLVIVSSAGTHGVPETVTALLDGRMDKPVRQHELRDCLNRLYSSAAAAARSRHCSPPPCCAREVRHAYPSG